MPSLRGTSGWCHFRKMSLSLRGIFHPQVKKFPFSNFFWFLANVAQLWKRFPSFPSPSEQVLPRPRRWLILGPSTSPPRLNSVMGKHNLHIQERLASMLRSLEFRNALTTPQILHSYMIDKMVSITQWLCISPGPGSNPWHHLWLLQSTTRERSRRKTRNSPWIPVPEYYWVWPKLLPHTKGGPWFNISMACFHLIIIKQI